MADNINQSLSELESIFVTSYEAKVGYDPLGSYGSYFLLPIIGPTSLLIYQRLVSRVETCMNGSYSQNIAELGQEMGLMENNVVKTGPNSPIIRSLVRVVNFGLAFYDYAGNYAVINKIPILSWNKQQRLTPRLRDMHDRFLKEV